MNTPQTRRLLLVLTLTLAGLPAASVLADYDPLAVPSGFNPETIDLTVHDAKRDRDIPLRVYLPAQKSPAPVLLFSHGLGGSREGSTYLGRHWAARGYVAIFLQHPGSDTGVWKDQPRGQRMDAMRQAASAQNFRLRLGDVSSTLDQLETWTSNGATPLSGRMDLARVGMSGHSFGAVTTQAVSGQRFGLFGAFGRDPRIRAAIMFSPSSPRRGSADNAFGRVDIPWMLMTGTKDIAGIGDADLASRLAVFPSLPPGGKYELVLEGAEHSAFTDRALPGEKGPRNPNHHRAILALSTAFWDAWLRGDQAAREWLDGPGARAVLEPRDRWQLK
ncbi:MAG: alpha/beta hydrolase family protein [Chthoniobacterales bacterium]